MSDARRHRRFSAFLASAVVVVAIYVVGYVQTRSAAEQLTRSRSLSTRYRDGTFSGWGRGRHGRIEVTVVIKRGRIASAAITQCRTRYPCSWVDALPAQVMSRQSAEVDAVSGATQSTEAYSRAIDQALAQAAVPPRPR